MSARDLMELDEPIVVTMPIFKPGDRIKHTVISKRELFVHLEGIQEPVPAHRLQVPWTQMSVRPRRSFAATVRSRQLAASPSGSQS